MGKNTKNPPYRLIWRKYLRNILFMPSFRPSVWLHLTNDLTEVWV